MEGDLAVEGVEGDPAVESNCDPGMEGDRGSVEGVEGDPAMEGVGVDPTVEGNLVAETAEKGRVEGSRKCRRTTVEETEMVGIIMYLPSSKTLGHYICEHATMIVVHSEQRLSVEYNMTIYCLISQSSIELRILKDQL